MNGDALIGKKQVMAGIVNSAKLNRLNADERSLNRARTEITITTAVQHGVRRSISSTTAQRDSAATAQVQLGEQLLTAIASVDDTRRLAMVDGLDFPLVVLDAYVKAANVMAVSDPSCGIRLVGAGRHRPHRVPPGAPTAGPTVLHRRQPEPTHPRTIALDGSNNTAVITGPVNGPDRAQGPMQFITSTWAKWGRDGNGDGVVDIQNFYDAADAAAAYLCAGGPMNTVAGLERGYFSYNQSLTYVAQVLSEAEAYGNAIKLPLASRSPPPPARFRPRPLPDRAPDAADIPSCVGEARARPPKRRVAPRSSLPGRNRSTPRGQPRWVDAALRNPEATAAHDDPSVRCLRTPPEGVIRIWQRS